MQQEKLKFQTWWDFTTSFIGTLFWAVLLVYIYRIFFIGGAWFGLGFGMFVFILATYLFLDWFGYHGYPSLVLTSFLHDLDEKQISNLTNLNGKGFVIRGKQYKFKVIVFDSKVLVFVNNQIFKVY